MNNDSVFAITADNLLKAWNLFRYKNTEQIIHLLLSRYVVANGELDTSLNLSATKLFQNETLFSSNLGSVVV